MKRTRPIDTKRMFLIPLGVIFFTMIVFGYITFSVTVMQFKRNMIDTGSTLAETLSHSIEDNLIYKEEFIDLLDTNLINIGQYIINHRDSISNEFLLEFTETYTLTHIYWYNPDGMVLYDAKDEHVGWTPEIGDPIYNFLHSGLDVYAEPIRKGTENDIYYKFVYLRADDGYFIQLGIEADLIYEMLLHYEYQTILEHFVEKNPELLYALIVNTDYVSIADTDTEAIGVDYSGDDAYEEAFLGNTNGSDWFYDEINETVLEIATPIYHNGEVIGILGIGYSYEQYYTLRAFLVNIFAALILLILIIYTIVQYVKIITPLQSFSKVVESIDLDNITYLHDVESNSVISGLNKVFRGLINNIFEKDNENKVIIKKMTNLAFTDQLTQLPNRIASVEILNNLCSNQSRVAVMYLDIDNFKSINDTKGHYYGDLLIQSIATRFRLIDQENLYISRHQGDEFIIIYAFKNENDLLDKIENIKSQFNEAIDIEGSSIFVEFSMGISTSPEDGRSADELLHKADIAMYEAKKEDKMTHMFFDETMRQSLSRKNMILDVLNHAIADDGFYIVYQPQINIDTNKIISMEALLRIKDSNISPYDFIPIAEKNRLINKIGRIVIEKVIMQQSEWTKNGIEIVPVYVNFSANQIQDYSISQFIKELLDCHHVLAEMIGVEITESTVIENRDLTIRTLTDLTSLGIKTAIDDFGSGQAGINYMTNFKVNMVKFDKSFSDKYLTEENLEIYRTILKLTHDLGFITLAEGIETKEQIDLLKSTDCKLVQGYYYYRPQTAELISKVLLKNKSTL